jgi:RNA-binding motif protein, X-linked 2
VRDKETGKSRGFAFLKYEDQRSTDLAVDNLGGAVIMGRTLKVDHTRYKKKDDEPDEGIDLEEQSRQIEEGDGEGRRKRRRTSGSESEEERPMIKEEREVAKLIQDHDEDDPMKAFLVHEKKEEVALALAKLKDGKRSERKHRHHRHHHKSRPKDEGEKDWDSRRSRHRKDGHRNRRSRSRD